jgi:nicotinamide-nucleotide amidase
VIRNTAAGPGRFFSARLTPRIACGARLESVAMTSHDTRNRPAALAILAIGDELVCGERVDTNSAWIASRAADLGMPTIEHRTVGDDRRRIADALRVLVAEATVLVVTGGLGPTLDDLTRPALADLLGEPLIDDQEALADLLAWYRSRGRPMPETNRVQARRPASARCLANPHGTAPGLGASVGGTAVFCLPGPPREMMPMFETAVAPVIAARADRAVSVRTVPTFGLGESAVAERLGDMMERTRDPLVGTTASAGIVTCRVRCLGRGPDADRRLDDDVARIRERLGPAVLTDHDAEDDGLVLVRVVTDLLRSRRRTVAVVESCTGGLLGEMLSRVPGASDVFVGGLLTYSNRLKSELAGVVPGLIERHGAVSREVAAAMAEGGRDRTGADFVLAITGVAGPGGGSVNKPVGTVWIALAAPEVDSSARLFRFRGGRDAVRLWAATTALGMLRLALLGTSSPLLGEVDGESSPV